MVITRWQKYLFGDNTMTKVPFWWYHNNKSTFLVITRWQKYLGQFVEFIILLPSSRPRGVSTFLFSDGENPIIQLYIRLSWSLLFRIWFFTSCFKCVINNQSWSSSYQIWIRFVFHHILIVAALFSPVSLVATLFSLALWAPVLKVWIFYHYRSIAFVSFVSEFLQYIMMGNTLKHVKHGERLVCSTLGIFWC